MALTKKEIHLYMSQAKEASQKRDYKQALTILTHITEQNQNYAEAYMELGSLCMISKTPERALPYLKRAIELAPDDLRYLWKYAASLVTLERKEEALIHYDTLVSSGSIDIPIEAISEWLTLIQELGTPVPDIRERVEGLSIANPLHPMLRYLYAQSCVAKLQRDKALVLFDEVYHLAPGNILMLEKLSYAYTSLGIDERSTACLEQILTIEPKHFAAIIGLAQNHKFAYGDDIFEKLNLLMADIALYSVEQRVSLHYALGKAYDSVGELSTAFEHYRLGGIAHAEGQHMVDHDKLHRYRVILEDHISSDIFRKRTIEGYHDRKPIFILGMPRSGTSLMEQVLSSFDGIYGAGELKYATDLLGGIDVGGYRFNFNKENPLLPDDTGLDYEERGKRYIELTSVMAPAGTQHIIDKMPDNFKVAGLIDLILPDASIIHSRRHPVETCLSAYRLSFSDGLHWSDDLEMMGKYYREYHNIMQFWKSVMPEGTILDVRYEDMVDDLETQSRRLADFIGIEWDEKCLAFHKNERAVRTASISQVRQPIYKSSTNRWRKYEPYLKPLLDEIGDLVEEYEAELVGRGVPSPTK